MSVVTLSLLNYILYLPTLTWTAGGDLFGFLVHYPEEVQEKLLVFQLPSSEVTVTKEGLLTELSSLIAQLKNSSDTVSNLIAHTKISPIWFAYICSRLTINCGQNSLQLNGLFVLYDLHVHIRSTVMCCAGS